MELLKIISYLSPVILFLGSVIGMFFWQRSSGVFRWITVYLVFGFIFDVFCRVYMSVLDNNLFLIPLFGIAQLVILSTVYLKFLLPQRIQLYMLPIIVFGCIYGLWDTWQALILPPEKVLSISRSVNVFILAVQGILYFFERMSSGANTAYLLPRLNTMIFMYSVFNFLIFLPFNFLIDEHSSIPFYFWAANLIITIAFYSLLTLTLWKHGKIVK